ncbi:MULTISPECIES: hypothetical protein [Sphingobacterium]|uniref:hypothetical protein n=1 Tax=Sphingobacterium TaxID=28453 RepID=UPI0013D94D31|nr:MULTISPECIES: hypothetical protein [unclassified Sphingobacterium]
MKHKELTLREVSEKIYHLLRLENNRYSIDLTKEQAKGLGIPLNQYQFIINELKTTNELIAIAEKEPNNEIELFDPKTLTAEMFQTLPSGVITTSDQSEGTNGFFAPHAMGKVRFRCRTNAALTPIYVCRTYSSGAWQSKTATGSLLTVTEVIVNLYVSNDNVAVGFRTSDSNGGSAAWQGIP